MDLVKILNTITEDEDVARLAIEEWFLGREPQTQARQMYTVELKGPSGNKLRIPKLTSSEEEAVAWAEKWANEHQRFAKFGPWQGRVVSVEN